MGNFKEQLEILNRDAPLDSLGLVAGRLVAVDEIARGTSELIKNNADVLDDNFCKSAVITWQVAGSNNDSDKYIIELPNKKILTEESLSDFIKSDIVDRLVQVFGYRYNECKDKYLIEGENEIEEIKGVAIAREAPIRLLETEIKSYIDNFVAKYNLQGDIRIVDNESVREKAFVELRGKLKDLMDIINCDSI